MPHLLFKLNGVPDDEADDVRSLLDQHSIDYYETTAGKWGVSMPAIWLPDEQPIEDAVSLLEQYQSDRSERCRQELQLKEEQGQVETVATQFWKQPIKFFLAVIAVGAVVGLTLYPFLNLIQGE